MPTLLPAIQCAWLTRWLVYSLLFECVFKRVLKFGQYYILVPLIISILDLLTMESVHFMCIMLIVFPIKIYPFVRSFGHLFVWLFSSSSLTLTLFLCISFFNSVLYLFTFQTYTHTHTQQLQINRNIFIDWLFGACIFGECENRTREQRDRKWQQQQQYNWEAVSL